MIGDLEEDEELSWRPPWETEEEASLDPPGATPRRTVAAAPDYEHPLLAPLARAQDAVARLEARVQAASEIVAEGLRARLSYRETAGWLSYAHVWLHPDDLALRDAGLTGSYGPAARSGRLAAELPATAAREDFEVPPSDVVVDAGLRLARLWRRLAELRTWAPLADAAAMRETLNSLGCQSGFSDAEADEWLGSFAGREPGLALIHAARAARDWMNRPAAIDPLPPDGTFLAACVWREKGFGRGVSLPFWAAPGQRHQRLALRVGTDWVAGFMGCVADGAKAGMSELTRLEQAEEKGRSLGRTARSRLPEAVESVLRAPIVTAQGLAHRLRVTPQAALGLLRQLIAAGLIREATGRASWRAFVLA